MRFTQRNRRFAALAVASAAMVAPLAVSPLSSQAAAPALAPITQVLYQMNEPANATVMLDSSGNGVNGIINQAGVDTGVVADGATGYFWTLRDPELPPASPERIVQVPDNPRLDPLSDTFTVEIRYRTNKKFGNVIQKGQSRTVGGQWKIQNPGGLPSCLFKGSGGKTAVRSKIFVSDNKWHTITCLREPTRLSMYVDGIFQGRKNGPSGNIDNKFPMTIGGKIDCDQIRVTCDYFTGNIDYVKLTRGS